MGVFAKLEFPPCFRRLSADSRSAERKTSCLGLLPGRLVAAMFWIYLGASGNLGAPVSLFSASVDCVDTSAPEGNGASLSTRSCAFIEVQSPSGFSGKPSKRAAPSTQRFSIRRVRDWETISIRSPSA